MMTFFEKSIPANVLRHPILILKYLLAIIGYASAPFLALATPDRKSRCKFLKSYVEMYKSTKYLQKNGLISHRLKCKDWDIANIMKDLTDGNLLDMGSSDSYILKNAAIKGIQGDKYGIDLQKPDVPVNGVKYVVGDLLNTPLPDSFFHNITCLSVIEHEIDIHRFTQEVARLLVKGGRLYLTFDYWSPKVIPALKLFGKKWDLLDDKDVINVIEVSKAAGLNLVEEVDWSLGRPLIDGTRYSPDPAIGYTFGILIFQKA